MTTHKFSLMSNVECISYIKIKNITEIDIISEVSYLITVTSTIMHRIRGTIDVDTLNNIHNKIISKSLKFEVVNTLKGKLK